MKNEPKALTDQDFKELAQFVFEDDSQSGYYKNVQHAEEAIRGHWAVKVENCITDGPGYVGDAYILSSGIFAPLIIVRTRDGSLRFGTNSN